MRTTGIRISGAIAAALLASAAWAQGGLTQPQQPGQPQTAPAPPPAGQAQAAPEQAQVFHRLFNENVALLEQARVASEKGGPRVKELASRLKSDHEKFGAELKQLAQERGVQLPDEAQAKAAAKPQADQLSAMSQADLDRTYTETMATSRKSAVDSMKAMRDSTPGKDARLKSWVDRWENVFEEQRNLAREARKDVQQRQGRRP